MKRDKLALIAIVFDPVLNIDFHDKVPKSISILKNIRLPVSSFSNLERRRKRKLFAYFYVKRDIEFIIKLEDLTLTGFFTQTHECLFDEKIQSLLVLMFDKPIDDENKIKQIREFLSQRWKKLWEHKVHIEKIYGFDIVDEKNIHFSNLGNIPQVFTPNAKIYDLFRFIIGDPRKFEGIFSIEMKFDNIEIIENDDFYLNNNDFTAGKISILNKNLVWNIPGWRSFKMRIKWRLILFTFCYSIKYRLINTFSNYGYFELLILLFSFGYDHNKIFEPRSTYKYEIFFNSDARKGIIKKSRNICRKLKLFFLLLYNSLFIYRQKYKESFIIGGISKLYKIANHYVKEPTETFNIDKRNELLKKWDTVKNVITILLTVLFPSIMVIMVTIISSRTGFDVSSIILKAAKSGSPWINIAILFLKVICIFVFSFLFTFLLFIGFTFVYYIIKKVWCGIKYFMSFIWKKLLHLPVKKPGDIFVGNHSKV